MAEELSETGAYAFLWATEVSFDAQVIGFPEYLERYRALLELLPRSSGLATAFSSLVGEPLFWKNDERGDVEWPEDSDKRRTHAEGRGEGHDGSESNSGRNADRDDLVRFMSAPSEVLDGPWIFHKTDLDHWPSVPHGHLKKDNRFKLDAYRGWTFDPNRGSAGRESRTFIRRLWNDAKFREQTVHCLAHFIRLHKKHNWRAQREIINPRRLPFGYVWPEDLGI